ncbi:hypothetical protein CA13_03260 [Planctomycetes bacterium CA13]|uniref:Uncharacterized protein n=1 Tax=Novipirellula herctigrandis TaxID=2527986 RepID=A0A5C5YV52_9BACT|nr:hypothetical protein CA13_03260 [Planctomycetes bacterium CA13]
MKRSFKNIVVAFAAATSLATSGIPSAQACGGGGGFRRSVSRPSYSRPSYSQPAYHQPSYSQSVYSQPAYQQPTYAPATSQVSYQSLPIQAAPIQAAPIQAAPVQAAPVQSAPTQSVPRPRVVSQPTPKTQRNSSPGRSVAAAQKPSVVVQQATTSTNSESSALQMLASLNAPATENAATTASQIPEFTAAASPTSTSQPVASHVGSWKVSLPGNQSVDLKLNNDGSFAWTATKEGKSSSFSGQFRLENGQLTLVRSNDLQQMTGTWTGSENSFTFKLDGATNGGLSFSRS